MPEFAVKLNSNNFVAGLGENIVLSARDRQLAEIAATTALAAGNFIDGGKAVAEAATSEGDFFSYSDGAGGIVYAVRDAVGSNEIAQAATKALVDAKVATADLGAEDGDSLVGTKAAGEQAILRTLQSKISDFGVWATDYGADPTGVADSAPAFRAARNALAIIGAGHILAPDGAVFRLNTSESVDIYDVPSEGAAPIVQTVQTCLYLPKGVGLKCNGMAKLKRSGGSIKSIIIGVDWDNAEIDGFEIEGPGGSNNSQHGIIFYPSSNFNHVMRDFKVRNLYIHDVGSYGLACTVQTQGGMIENIKTRRTGADGIDWKQRLSNLNDYILKPYYVNSVDIDEFALREGAGTPTGIGLRGFFHANDINVRGIPTVMVGGNPVPLTGIDCTAGIASNGDIRPSASFSTLTNWYAEGADPKGDVIAVNVYGSAGVRVGIGTAKWARCQGSPFNVSNTAYGFDDGGMFEGVTVIPAHGRAAFRATARGTHFRGRIISDKVYFDARRGNLAVGQSDLPLPFASTTNNGAARFLVKINGSTRTILTETTHYTWGTNKVTLVTPAASGDQYIAVFPPVQGFRIEAENCSVDGVQDYFVPSRFSISTQAAVDSGDFKVVWEGRPNIGQLNDPSIAGVAVSDPNVANKNLRLQPKGTGITEASRPGGINMPTTAASAQVGQFWYDPTDGNTIKYKPS